MTRPTFDAPPSVLATFIGGPFDAEARVIAKVRANQESDRAARLRQAADHDLEQSKRVHSEACANADILSSTAAKYSAIVGSP